MNVSRSGSDPLLAVGMQTAAGQRMPDFKPFVFASATLGGIEVASMIRKGQLTLGLCPFVQFAALTVQTRKIKGLVLSSGKFAAKPSQTPNKCDLRKHVGNAPDFAGAASVFFDEQHRSIRDG